MKFLSRFPLMREQRKLTLLRRQQMLAKIARREAIRSLAEAVTEETKSAALATKSRELAVFYQSRAGKNDGESVSRLGQFSGSLAALAGRAEQSRHHALGQIERGQEALAAADNRMRRLSERAVQAQLDLESEKEQRETAHQKDVARKLQISAKDELRNSR
ncbi:hypothetical protein [Erythrobacter sp. F6033]|uniref:hypothetical protein n=1 Tax=Erythrobacter sp. F6033 TaxID=2926401 RepID=UPI001FF19087|nr:hypothetical protein [Erythrobacter sp. F6033]MCK0129421.1 hypothetical protein [Erythrobacter sp. F6033]